MVAEAKDVAAEAVDVAMVEEAEAIAAADPTQSQEPQPLFLKETRTA